MFQIPLCHLTCCVESALSEHRVFFQVSSKYYTLERILSKKPDSASETREVKDLYGSFNDGSVPAMSKRMIKQISLYGLSFKRMNLILSFKKKINTNFKKAYFYILLLRKKDIPS